MRRREIWTRIRQANEKFQKLSKVQMNSKMSTLSGLPNQRFYPLFLDIKVMTLK